MTPSAATVGAADAMTPRGDSETPWQLVTLKAWQAKPPGHGGDTPVTIVRAPSGNGVVIGLFTSDRPWLTGWSRWLEVASWAVEAEAPTPTSIVTRTSTPATVARVRVFIGHSPVRMHCSGPPAP